MPEPGSEAADRLLAEALERGVDVIGPAFLPVEVLSVLRKHVHRGTVTPEQADRSVASLLVLPIEPVDGREVYDLAWRIAGELSLPVVYDAVYLAVSELRRAEFWTADRVLFEKAKGRGYVRLLGEGANGEA